MFFALTYYHGHAQISSDDDGVNVTDTISINVVPRNHTLYHQKDQQEHQPNERYGEFKISVSTTVLLYTTITVFFALLCSIAHCRRRRHLNRLDAEAAQIREVMKRKESSHKIDDILNALVLETVTVSDILDQNKSDRRGHSLLTIRRTSASAKNALADNNTNLQHSEEGKTLSDVPIRSVQSDVAFRSESESGSTSYQRPSANALRDLEEGLTKYDNEIDDEDTDAHRQVIADIEEETIRFEAMNYEIDASSSENESDHEEQSRRNSLRLQLAHEKRQLDNGENVVVIDVEVPLAQHSKQIKSQAQTQQTEVQSASSEEGQTTSGSKGQLSDATCSICLLGFEVGNNIAWSRNPHCNHAFHENCIFPWLIRHDECPNCRHSYFVYEGSSQHPRQPSHNHLSQRNQTLVSLDNNDEFLSRLF